MQNTRTHTCTIIKCLPFLSSWRRYTTALANPRIAPALPLLQTNPRFATHYCYLNQSSNRFISSCSSDRLLRRALSFSICPPMKKSPVSIQVVANQERQQKDRVYIAFTTSTTRTIAGHSNVLHFRRRNCDYYERVAVIAATAICIDKTRNLNSIERLIRTSN